MSSYKDNGVVSKEDIQVPDEGRLDKGPVVILECVEEIPCNPCVASCPTDAIDMDEITDIPKVDFESCVGCGKCVLDCPGLAIFVIDCSYSQERCKITVPYEYLPIPEEGDEVKALDRKGKEIDRGKVTDVKNDGKTYAITMEVDRNLVWKVRGLEVIG